MVRPAHLFIAVALIASAGGAEPLFNRDVRPILSDKCFACHGFDAKKRKGDRRLDTPEGAMAEKDGVQAIKPGDLAASEAWLRIVSDDPEEVMPPPKSHKTLTAAEKETLRRWIEQGAKYQRHWSFEPPVKANPPHEGNPVDAFIGARLSAEKLAPSPEADRETLIRRVSFALTGLPPAVAEVDTFLSDASPGAYERMVDRCLASPRYGEQMARHWLDVARYGDTHGMHLDNERSMWPYRDWVVNAFNRNQHFDQFTIEQLAGDLLPNATQEQLVATGFNRCNVTTGEGGSIDAEWLFRYAVDRTSTTVETWMGLTAGCAVCHDHKFDPISQKEFYQLYAFFYSAADPAMDGNVLLTAPTVQLITPEQTKQREDLEARLAETQKEFTEQVQTVAYNDPAEIQPRPPAQPVENVWIEDDAPAGETFKPSPGEPSNWVVVDTGRVLSGQRALKRSDKAYVQDVCEGKTVSFEILPEGKIFAHVFLEPDDLPKLIMMQFHFGDWEHRVVWGDYEAEPWGVANTPSKVNMGALPEAGKWVRLEFEASQVGLQPGDKLDGIAFTQHGGTVTWDKIGSIGSNDPAFDPQRSLVAWIHANEGKPKAGMPKDVEGMFKKPAKDRTPAEQQRLREHFLTSVCAETRPQFDPLHKDIAATQKERDDLNATLPGSFIMRDLPKPRQANIMLRGAYDKPGDPVERAVPAIFPPMQDAPTPNRLDLAKWLMSDTHPLTARVTVNRFWQQFFGTGLVKSSGDFGSQSEPPSHPELLDWLAVSFRESGWDVKQLVRLIVTSATFRQSSRLTPDLWKVDPENRLLARGPRLRLDAEEMRDNALFASGLINLKMGGKGVKPYQPPNIWEPVGFVGSNTSAYTQDHGDALYRRSLYTFFKRTAPPPFMSSFDGPNRESFCSRRERSNTPLQALQLMNDVQHFEAARAFAERLMTEGGATPAERITFAYRTALARRPSPEEIAIVEDDFTKHLAKYQAQPEAAKKTIRNGESPPKPGLPEPELAAWTMVANLVLNLDETVTRN
jgi:hypothetical protein